MALISTPVAVVWTVLASPFVGLALRIVVLLHGMGLHCDRLHRAVSAARPRIVSTG
ncbi:MAG: hypothetical protein HRU01_02140 [Myxococcales bacterium]|nr:hypothetical protein [Myxococcales bacterium]